jgi:hypothetical protein
VSAGKICLGNRQSISKLAKSLICLPSSWNAPSTGPKSKSAPAASEARLLPFRPNGTEWPESTATIRLPGLILSMGNDAATLARQCGQFMKLRTGEPWMPAQDYGRSLKALTINLLVRNMDKALQFQREVLRADIVYSDMDFAVVRGYDAEWMLHADHTYHGHPMESVLANAGHRGAGAELRLHGCDPDGAEASGDNRPRKMHRGKASPAKWCSKAETGISTNQPIWRTFGTPNTTPMP